MQLADVRRVFAYIGKATYDADPLFVGNFKEFRIYNSPLNPLAILLNNQMGPDSYSGTGSCFNDAGQQCRQHPNDRRSSELELNGRHYGVRL
jgi:hypothetical protein